MASSYQSFKDIDLTKDEVERFTDALKDKNFRKLLVDYVDEIRDPENQKIYQKEITELEKERGIDVTFINPVAGYVIKTSLDGNTKVFINICTNENVEKPSSKIAFQDGSRGLQWNLPHSVAPPREDLDKKGIRCQVYDVVFHPDTLHLAQKNKAFRNMVNKTACDVIESNFDVALDKKNLRFPRMKYKGLPHAAVIRKPSKEPPVELHPEEKAIMDKLYAQIEPSTSPKPTSKAKTKKKEDDRSEYTTPKYVIKHRQHIEMEEFIEHKTAKLNAATPKELAVEIKLPLLKSPNDIILDITEKTLHLTTEKYTKYKLNLTLPYRVNEDVGNAKFDKTTKTLIVTLSVKAYTEILLSDSLKDDSGVESDHGSMISTSPTNEVEPSLVTELKFATDTNCSEDSKNDCLEKPTFLNPDLCYSLPEFTANFFLNTIAFTFNVKNVTEASVSKFINETGTDFHIKFSSISSGFYSTYYSFYAQFLQNSFDKDMVSVEIWDNNVTVHLHFKPSDAGLTSYLFGLDKNNLSQKCLEEPEILHNSFQKVLEDCDTKDVINIGKSKRKDKRRGKKDIPKINAEMQECIAINICKAQYESSGDEVSHSYSPTKSRGILKGLPNPRRFGRSISESGLDEAVWVSSVENCTSLDSVIPEEGEMLALKKTVRFNDVVSRQLFRSNSSILGQRKKNQRKAKAKKRAQERRHSDGETIEVTNCKERDIETGDEVFLEKESNDSDGNIFELDLNS